MNSTLSKVFFASVVCLLQGLITPPVQSALLYDNLGSLTAASDPVFSFGPLYDSFSVGSGAFNLEDVKVKLSGDPAFGGSIEIGLFDDNATTPGSQLLTVGTLSDTLLSSTPADFDFPLLSPFVLDANTRYWLGITAGSDGTSAQWAWSLDQFALGVAGEFFANQSGVFDNINGPYQMQLSGTIPTSPIPEPSTLALLGAAAALAAARRRAPR